MRILMVGHAWFDDSPGGADRYLADVAHGLAARGHAVTVAVPRLSAAAPAEADSHGVRVLRLDAPAGFAGKIWALWRAAGRLGDFDVVHTHFALNGLAFLWHPRLARARRVCQFQGPWAEESRVEGDGPAAVAVKKAIEKAAYARCHRFITLSEAFKALLARDYGVTPGKIVVVPAAVDTDRFTPGPVPSGPPTAFVMRRLVKRMGLDVLVEAWKGVRARHPEARLLIAGTGPMREALEAQAGPGVAFLGRVPDDDLVRRYREATVTIVPTTALEGFGLVTVESLACGTPVVGTTAGATPEILGPLDPRLLVPPGDAAALAAAVSACFDDPEAFPSRGTCRDYAVSRYSWPGVLDRLEGVLEGG